jgi:hypothetical protein
MDKSDLGSDDLPISASRTNCRLKQQAGLQSFRVRLGISTATLLRHEAIELLEPILVHPPMLPLVHRARAAS